MTCSWHHDKSLVCKTSDLNERNYLVRVIYKDCYWFLSTASILLSISFCSLHRTHRCVCQLCLIKESCCCWWWWCWCCCEFSKQSSTIHFYSMSYAERCLRYGNVSQKYYVQTNEHRMMPSSHRGSPLIPVLANVQYIGKASPLT